MSEKGDPKAREARIREALLGFGAERLTSPDPKKSGVALSAVMPGERMLEASEWLLKEGYTLLDLSTCEFQEGFLVSYHLDSFTEPFRLALRVLVKDKEKPVTPSIHPAFQGAEWHERESFDFFGVVFEGNPNLVPLLLPHDLPGPPPLRKDPKALASLDALGILGDGAAKEGGKGKEGGENGV
ncbi:MAG: NADH-quinone oxidoreductase subunit C [Deltaproteobacteria bacterium]|jgi:NADH-quinone oxidoreductase subunit C|nr:NADH-quinone oxidoreductase subunit C [Deltaproteobacteria bacterium]